MIDKDQTRDRAGKGYWDRTWASASPETPAVDEFGPGIRNYVNRRLAGLFESKLASVGANVAGTTFLEVGCARSRWLPYFSTRRGFRVTGIDYSEIGCAEARALLLSQGVVGEIVCADMFQPPGEMLRRFDVVFSNGLAEHFDDTAACLKAIARFLRPGGICITSVPNLAGLFGALQKRLDRAVYDLHVPLTATQLAAATTAAGLELISCEYFLFANSGILTIDPRIVGIGLPAKRLLVKVMHAFTFASWWLDGSEGRLPPNRLTSPYVVCLSRKLDDAPETG
jgi:2-polyprenyl-3-methyl-5-hydroxy-6-metoxy-1,4-benzoquinol methylase